MEVIPLLLQRFIFPANQLFFPPSKPNILTPFWFNLNINISVRKMLCKFPKLGYNRLPFFIARDLKQHSC